MRCVIMLDNTYTILFISFSAFGFCIIKNMESNEYIVKNRILTKDSSDTNTSECICYRPHSNIICNCCGFWTKGRVRYSCPLHPKVSILLQSFYFLSIMYTLYSNCL